MRAKIWIRLNVICEDEGGGNMHKSSEPVRWRIVGKSGTEKKKEEGTPQNPMVE